MPDIGDTLREARMRAGLDISDIESETKIRAKYLRAIENEEWGLLPGSTFVKSFLRTYAEELGLDGRLLVEEFKQRHENLSEVELQPISPPGQRDRRPPPSRFGRAPAILVVVLILVAALYLLGRGTGDKKRGSGTVATTGTATSTTRTTGRKTSTTPAKASAPRRVSLQLVPTGPVSVCLTAGGKVLIPSTTLTSPTKVYRGRAFKVTLGNSAVVMKVGGKSLTVPEVANGIGYLVTPRGGRKVLSPSQRPTCGA